MRQRCIILSYNIIIKLICNILILTLCRYVIVICTVRLYLPIYKYLKKSFYITTYRYIVLKFTVCRSYRLCATSNKFIFISDRTKFVRTICDRVLKVNNFTVLSNILYIIHILYYPIKWLNLLKGEYECSTCIYHLYTWNTFSRIMFIYTNTR